MNIEVEQDVMEVNRAYAADNRLLFRKYGLLTVNIMGSPGAGKTALLEHMLKYMQQHLKVAVIEGDLATAKDARRIAALGVNVIQINTDGGCHLDAKMIARVLPGFYLEDIDLLLIENVGNLVCPAAFDLGEDMRMVVMSITEGGDKPSKYPSAFMTADVVALNKMDILEHTDIDLEQTCADILQINPEALIFETCCRKGEVRGVDILADQLIARVKEKRKAAR
ncbi:MAG: hydrogenase nickel incorporation protein HypB [Bacillota bacterium]|nr:hydrogenase nickel incorporation protein HypB [Bacillota bacterium]